MSRTRQLSNDGRKKTALCSVQVQERLIKPFNAKVEDEFGHYKKSKVLNALIEGYLSGRYVLKEEPRNDYDMEC